MRQKLVNNFCTPARNFQNPSSALVLLAYKPKGFEMTATDISESIEMSIKTAPYFNF
jgi:hypothetical protein